MQQIVIRKLGGIEYAYPLAIEHKLIDNMMIQSREDGIGCDIVYFRFSPVHIKAYTVEQLADMLNRSIEEFINAILEEVGLEFLLSRLSL